MKQSIDQILNRKSMENTEIFNDKDYFANKMKNYGLPVPEEKIYIKIPNARAIFENSFRYFLSKENKELVWFPEYEEVVKWIEDNDGRGLLLYGDCGRGKSMISRYVIPSILFAYKNKVICIKTAQEMNIVLDDVLEKKLISLDDIGTEDILNKFGNKRLALAEIMDAVERKSKLIIISTNLSGREIEQRYGTRTMERIISTTKRIEFKGDSLRR